MSVKVIAIGNRLMGDDSIGLKVAERLRGLLERQAIEVVISETDVEFGLSRIETGDVIFLLDATNYGLPAGTVTVSPASSRPRQRLAKPYAHELSLVDLLRTQTRFLRGYLIGIEAQEIGFSLELSPELQAAFDDICQRVAEVICAGSQTQLSRAPD